MSRLAVMRPARVTSRPSTQWARASAHFSVGENLLANGLTPLARSAVSFVEVNEEGTEAAAVTTAILRAEEVADRPKTFEMIVDRPFVFLIHDYETRTILFMGVVFEPRESPAAC